MHNVSTEEFVNIGVVMWVPAEKQFLYKLTERYGRLFNFFNGAGYCRWLGEQERFKKVLEQGSLSAQSTAARWMDTTPAATSLAPRPHGLECDTSCNRCLRDFYNLPYHGLLDWRLALDMVRVASSATAAIDLQSAVNGASNAWANLVGSSGAVETLLQGLRYERVALPGGLTGYVNQARGKMQIETHPLWTPLHPAYVEAVNAAQQQFAGYVVGQLNPFRLLRRPADYV